jgi:hypothetical protein
MKGVASRMPFRQDRAKIFDSVRLIGVISFVLSSLLRELPP